MATNELRFSRQQDMIRDPSGLSLLIIGAGGIGSNALHLAVSTGFERITIVDPDFVAEENLAPAYFSRLALSLPKVEALDNDMYDRYGVMINAIQSRLEDADLLQQESFDIVIISTDTIESRQDIWTHFAKHLCHGLWIDARMGGVLATVYAVEMDDPSALADYTEELSISTNGTLPCGMKATAPLTKGWIPGMIGTVLYNAANGAKPPYMQRCDMGMGIFIVQGDAPQLYNEETPDDE